MRGWKSEAFGLHTDLISIMISSRIFFFRSINVYKLLRQKTFNLMREKKIHGLSPKLAKENFILK